MIKEVICTICPVGCNIIVEGEGDKVFSITGNQCNRGIEYSTNEFLHPARILTTTVKVENSSTILLPVRSNKPIPKELIMQAMKVIKKVTVEPPIKSHDVIISNICGCGVDIIATRNIEEERK